MSLLIKGVTLHAALTDVNTPHLLAELENAVCSETELAAAIPKAKLETRDMAAASGDVSYTGYGFQPTGLLVLGIMGAYGAVGSSEPALTEHCINIIDTSPYIATSPTLNRLLQDVGKLQYCVVKTYDADGFTLTWTKDGDAIGTAYLHIFAFK